MHASDAASTLTARATGGSLPVQVLSGACLVQGLVQSLVHSVAWCRPLLFVASAHTGTSLSLWAVCRRSGLLLPGHSHPPSPTFCPPPSPGHTLSPHDNHSFAVAIANAHIPFSYPHTTHYTASRPRLRQIRRLPTSYRHNPSLSRNNNNNPYQQNRPLDPLALTPSSSTQG